MRKEYWSILRSVAIIAFVIAGLYAAWRVISEQEPIRYQLTPESEWQTLEEIMFGDRAGER